MNCQFSTINYQLNKQAVDKALEEYRKYQVATLSPVEQAYFEAIKELEKIEN